MPQSKWEKAFWAAARSDKFKPYPPEHWRNPKTKQKRRKKSTGRKKAGEGTQLTLFA